MSNPEEINFATVWTAAGIVVAFSVNVIVWRIGREAANRLGGVLWWLPRADFVLLGALAVTLIGVFVAPVLGAGLAFARYALGLAFVLLAGYPFALAGHYEILRGELPKKLREEIDEAIRKEEAAAEGEDREPAYAYVPPYLPVQEKKTLRVIAGACIIYVLAVVAVEVF